MKEKQNNSHFTKNKVIYATKDECLKAIATIEALGYEAAPWMLEQLKAFEDAESIIPTTIESDTPIWDTLKANYPYGVMPQEKIDCVESSVRQLLEEGEHADEPGLLLGKIQCGKTDTFEDIIGLSFDKGVDIAIVITKGTKALVNQTIMRMKLGRVHTMPNYYQTCKMEYQYLHPILTGFKPPLPATLT